MSMKKTKVQRIQKNGQPRVLVTKDRHECANEKHIYEVLKEKCADVYGDVEVSENKVLTREGEPCQLTSIPKIRAVLRSMQTQLHDNGVLHGDLKPEHILESKFLQVPFFIDFGCSLIITEGKLQEVRGFTTKWASLDLLVRSTAHELDDYEAVLTVALVHLGEARKFTLPPHPNRKSVKSWSAWKLQMMEQVFAYYLQLLETAEGTTQEDATQQAGQTESPEQALAWVVHELLFVWTLPRDCKRLSQEQRADLVDPMFIFQLDIHVEDIRGKFSSHLGSAKGLKSVHLSGQRDKGSATEEVESRGISHALKNKEVSECPNVTLWKFPLPRPSEGWDSKETLEHGEPVHISWAEYGTLLVYGNDIFDEAKQHGEAGQLWDYGEAWDSFGAGEFGVKLIKRIGGKYLCLESTRDLASGEKQQPHIADFLAKFEPFVSHYAMRPLDVLLLVIGLQIECHEQAFFPQQFRHVVEAVQHQDWECAGKTCLASLDSAECSFRACECGRVFCSLCSLDHAASPEGQHSPATRECRVAKGLLPNLPLFVLLLAGRVRLTNRIVEEGAGDPMETSTAKKPRKLAERQRRERELEKELAGYKRSTAESLRCTAEHMRSTIESVTSVTESKKSKAESKKRLAEVNRDTAATYKTLAELKKHEVETARTTAELKQTIAETSKVLAEQAEKDTALLQAALAAGTIAWAVLSYVA